MTATSACSLVIRLGNFAVSGWLTHLVDSFANQTATWFVAAILSLLGIFSARLAAAIKFALNKADARAKYYEEMAVDISHFVFIIDRMVKVYYGSTWVSDEGKNAIAGEYDEVMNTISRKEFVYRSWVKRFWNRKMANAFDLTMEKIRDVDRILRLINEGGDQKENLKKLDAAFRDLREAAYLLLVDGV